MSEAISLDNTGMRLRRGHLLPEKAKEIAKIVKENEPIRRPDLEKIIDEHESLERSDISRNVRLLRMSENVIIEDEEARIGPVRCGESGLHVMEKFRRWKNSSSDQI